MGAETNQRHRQCSSIVGHGGPQWKEINLRKGHRPKSSQGRSLPSSKSTRIRPQEVTLRSPDCKTIKVRLGTGTITGHRGSRSSSNLHGQPQVCVFHGSSYDLLMPLSSQPLPGTGIHVLHGCHYTFLVPLSSNDYQQHECTHRYTHVHIHTCSH